MILKPLAIHTGLMKDGGMEIKPQIVRISADTESSGRVPELQFSDSLSGNNFCAQNRTGRNHPCKLREKVQKYKLYF